jgi:hypothetical protein
MLKALQSSTRRASTRSIAAGKKARRAMSDERPITVLGFAGSLRKDSYNRALLRAAVEAPPAGMLAALAGWIRGFS